MDTIQFQDRKESVEFYEKRYSHGYMGHWSSFDKERLSGLIRSMNLPEQGSALDFGCGRGIFTQVIKKALPGWKIFGCDISSEAIESAKKNSPGINFFVLGDKDYSGLKVDFIHSHHVLEHTFDEIITAGEMASFAGNHCFMLHSLPCNHEGSLEYKLAHWTKNGFDAPTGKFFFEDTAHIRRMNSMQAAALFTPFGFRLARENYSNQFWGAIKWIAESNFGTVWKIANPMRANSFSSFISLAIWREWFLLCWFCFFTAYAFRPTDHGKYYYLKKFIQVICFLLFFWLAIPVTMFVTAKARKEWELNKDAKSGTDMFLFFER